MSDVDNNKALVRRFIQALDTDELGILNDICTPEVAKEWRDGINTGQPFSDHHIELRQMVADAENVMIVLDTRGLMAGEFHGIPPPGKRYTNRARSTSTSMTAGSRPSTPSSMTTTS